MKKFILTMLAGAAFAPLGAQTLSPDLQVMINEMQEQKHLLSADDPKHEEPMRLYVRYTDAEAVSRLEALGVKVIPEFASGFATAVIPMSLVTEASQIAGIEYIERGGEPRTLLKTARAKSQIDIMHTNSWKLLPQGYTGKGVVVGIIDIGLEFNHINFRDANGNSRIKRVWAQGARGKSPEKFGYGAEFTTPEEIASAGRDTNSSYHGTHVTGIATGSESTLGYHGVATDADIVFVGFNNSQTNYNADIANAIRYIFDYADEVDKPCVINMSLGSHQGPHDGTSTLDRAIDALTGPGRIVVGACGNEGLNKLHVGKKLTATDNTLKTMLAFPTGSKANLIDIWNRTDKEYTVQGVVVDNLKGKILAQTPEHLVSNTGNFKATIKSFFADECGVDGDFTIISSRDPDTQCYNTYVSVNCTQAGASRKLGLVVKGEDGDEINMWSVGLNDFINGDKPGWTAGSTSGTVGEIGGTANRIIAVGSYNSGNMAYPWHDPDHMYQFKYDLDVLSDFSSEGPTVDGRLKPEICAPGLLITSSTNKGYYLAPNQINGPRVADSKNEYYYWDLDAGTSMAAPMVTGTIAAWLEAYPELTPEDIVDALKEGAVTDRHTGTCPNQKAGYGKLGAYNSLYYLYHKYSSNDHVIDNPDSELKVWADAATRTVYTSLAGAEGTVEIDIYNMAGTRVAGLTANVNGPVTLGELSHGVYVATASCNGRTARVKLSL